MGDRGRNPHTVRLQSLSNPEPPIENQKLAFSLDNIGTGNEKRGQVEDGEEKIVFVDENPVQK